MFSIRNMIRHPNRPSFDALIELKILGCTIPTTIENKQNSNNHFISSEVNIKTTFTTRKIENRDRRNQSLKPKISVTNHIRDEV